MNKYLFIFYLLLFSITVSSAQITFQNIYTGNSDNSAASVKQTSDGGYIITGSTTSFTGSDADIYLIRTDVNGDTLWTRTYGGSSYEEANEVEQTYDNGFIVVGSTSSFGAGLDDIYLIKTDANGDTLWTKTYGGTDDDEGYSVQQTPDSGFIITGSTMSYGAGDDDVYLIKTDKNGNPLWSKTYGGTSIDVGNCVQLTKDGGYIITGETFSFGAGQLDVYLVKIDTNGTLQWSKTYGGSADDDGIAIQQTSDRGYIITGYTASFGAGNYDAFLIKTDDAGSVSWSKAYGDSAGDEGYSVQQTKDGGYIVCGSTSSFGAGNSDVYLIKTNNVGDTLWTKTYGGTDYDGGNSVRQTNDDGYIITGYSNIPDPGGPEDIYLVKTDSIGNTGCNEDSTTTIVTFFIATTENAATIVSSGDSITSTATIVNSGGNITTLCTTVGIHEVAKNNSATVFPNPFTSSATLVINTPLPSSHCLLIIYDLMGQVVQQSSIQSKATTIDRKGLSDGLYFYRVTDEQSMISSGKLIIQ